MIELRVVFVDARSVRVRITAEGDIQILQELVTAGKERLGRVGARIDSWLTVEDNDTVGKISGHDEIVLDDKSSFLSVHDETFDDTDRKSVV